MTSRMERLAVIREDVRRARAGDATRRVFVPPLR